jgi:hypothetical protein
MKQFFTLSLIAGALMVSAASQARMVATKAQCVAACDGNGSTSDNCGWITKRAKFNRCRSKLILKCRKFSPATMCPVPPPPTTTTTVPAPFVTTTTQPYVAATTTTTTPRPTTTTLPVVTYPNLIRSYTFSGTCVSDPCGVVGLGTDYTLGFSVTSQVGTSLSGVIGKISEPSVGTYTPSTGGWNLGTQFYDSSTGCTYQFSIGVGSPYMPTSDGYLIYDGICGGYDCEVQFSGSVY